MGGDGHPSAEEWRETYADMLDLLGDSISPPTPDPVLARMVGVWSVTGDWQVVVGRPPTPLGGRVVNRWLLHGRFVESDTYPSNGAVQPSSRAIYGFDAATEGYFAFAINGLSQQYDIEQGVYDPDTDSLLLRGVELVLPGRREIRFLRTVHFAGPDEIELGITYPEEPDRDRMGGLAMTMRRSDAGDAA